MIYTVLTLAPKSLYHVTTQKLLDRGVQLSDTDTLRFEENTRAGLLLTEAAAGEILFILAGKKGEEGPARQFIQSRIRPNPQREVTEALLPVPLPLEAYQKEVEMILHHPATRSVNAYLLVWQYLYTFYGPADYEKLKRWMDTEFS